MLLYFSFTHLFNTFSNFFWFSYFLFFYFFDHYCQLFKKLSLSSSLFKFLSCNTFFTLIKIYIQPFIIFWIQMNNLFTQTRFLLIILIWFIISIFFHWVNNLLTYTWCRLYFIFFNRIRIINRELYFISFRLLFFIFKRRIFFCFLKHILIKKLLFIKIIYYI